MRSLTLLFIILAAAGCARKQPTTVYNVIVSKNNDYPAELEVNNVKYSFTETMIKKDIAIGEFDLIDVSLKYTAPRTAAMNLTLKQGERTIRSVSDNKYMWIIFSNSSPVASSGEGG